MGWWNAGKDGSSLQEEPTGLIWGDGPADIFASAIAEIVTEFRRDWNRNPGRQEILSGLLFSVGEYTPEEFDAWLEETTPWTRDGQHPRVNSTKRGSLNAFPRRSVSIRATTVTAD